MDKTTGKKSKSNSNSKNNCCTNKVEFAEATDFSTNKSNNTSSNNTNSNNSNSNSSNKSNCK